MPVGGLPSKRSKYTFTKLAEGSTRTTPEVQNIFAESKTYKSAWLYYFDYKRHVNHLSISYCQRSAAC
jgi:hypothetical protein